MELEPQAENTGQAAVNKPLTDALVAVVRAWHKHCSSVIEKRRNQNSNTMNMKNKWLAMAGVVASMAVTTAQAIPISGSIGFTGAFTANGETTPGDLSTATSMTINSVLVATTTGDLVGAVNPVFISPIGVNGNPPVLVGAQLWSVQVIPSDTYTFDVATSLQTFTSPGQINLAGSGIMYRNGGDATAGTWQLGFGRTGASFTWQSTSGTNVPDGGTTVLLLGFAFSALGVLRKQFMA